MRIGDIYRTGIFTLDATDTLATCARRLEGTRHRRVRCRRRFGDRGHRHGARLFHVKAVLQFPARPSPTAS